MGKVLQGPGHAESCQMWGEGRDRILRHICSIKITFLMTTAEILGSQSDFPACRSSETSEIWCWAEYNLLLMLHSEKCYVLLELALPLDNFVDLLHRLSIGMMTYISEFILFYVSPTFYLNVKNIFHTNIKLAQALM